MNGNSLREDESSRIIGLAILSQGSQSPVCGNARIFLCPFGGYLSHPKVISFVSVSSSRSMLGGGGVEHFGCHPVTWRRWLPAVADQSGQLKIGAKKMEKGSFRLHAPQCFATSLSCWVLRSSLAAEIQPCEPAKLDTISHAYNVAWNPTS